MFIECVFMKHQIQVHFGGYYCKHLCVDVQYNLCIPLHNHVKNLSRGDRGCVHIFYYDSVRLLKERIMIMHTRIRRLKGFLKFLKIHRQR